MDVLTIALHYCVGLVMINCLHNDNEWYLYKFLNFNLVTWNKIELKQISECIGLGFTREDII